MRQLAIKSLLADRSTLCRPWSVDRWGRLLAGLAVLVGTILSIVHHPAWLWGALAVAVNLVVTSFTNRCLIHALLIRLGVREREDLFLPGGSPRSGSGADGDDGQELEKPIASTDS